MGAWISGHTAHDLYVANREAELISLQKACGHREFKYRPSHRHSRGRQICIAAAQVLHAGESVTKSMGGVWLGRGQYPFDVMMTQEYARCINFAGLTLDEALVRYLRPIELPQRNPDASEVFSAFADAYFHDNCKKGTMNATPFASSDVVFAFTLFVFMLLTDFTSREIATKITLDKWIAVNSGINDGKDFTRQFLVDVYDRLAPLKDSSPDTPDCA